MGRGAARGLKKRRRVQAPPPWVGPFILWPESTEGMRGGWLRKGREAWVMGQLSIFTDFDHLNREMFTVFDDDFHGH